jgi:hypothetical protein
MRRLHVLLFLTGLYFSLAVSAAELPKLWTAEEGFERPESVYYYPETQLLFVSNIAGNPAQKDGTGWISKLNIDGKVLEAKWVDGLDAPKGIRSFKGMLWVSNIDEIIGIEIATGKIVHRVTVPGVKFLNDVAIGADGTVYVSEFAQNKIIQLKDGKVSVFAEGPKLENPNGLIVDGNKLIVGAWGKPEPDFTTKVPGHLFSLDLNTGKKTLITPEPIANMDGVELDGTDGYIVTDWFSGKVLHISSGGETELVGWFGKGIADHAYIPEKNLLILPHMLENRVSGYKLKK